MWLVSCEPRPPNRREIIGGGAPAKASGCRVHGRPGHLAPRGAKSDLPRFPRATSTRTATSQRPCWTVSARRHRLWQSALGMSTPGSGDRSSAFSSDSVPDGYERYLVPAVFEPWGEVLLDVVGIAPGSRVLDIASGTGVLARAAARRAGGGGLVVASDVSGPMLARAAIVGAPDRAAPIEYRDASADALPFDDGSFDVVLCQQGLQFFPARAAAVGEMRRVLRPGGVAGVAVWASGYPLEPFGVYSDELAATGAEPPFPERSRARPSRWRSTWSGRSS